MRIVRVGDPHVKINNLADSAKLIEYVKQVAETGHIDRIELLGDLFHNHAVIRAEILDFWHKALRSLSSICETVVLVGNHDQTGDYKSNIHALSTLKDINPSKLHIIDFPTRMGPFAYMPYIHDEETFVGWANKLYEEGARILVCHATFEGSKYDNGMYAPDGFDPAKVKFDTIISGHIHTQQRFGKVVYPGTAKWDTNSDANEKKGIWIVNHTEDGTVTSEEFLDTSNVVTPIYSIEWKEGNEQPNIPSGRITVELIGSSDWVKKQKDKLKGQCSVKAKITDRIKERRQTGRNLSEFVANFTPIAGVSREEISEFLKELGLV